MGPSSDLRQDVPCSAGPCVGLVVGQDGVERRSSEDLLFDGGAVGMALKLEGRAGCLEQEV